MGNDKISRQALLDEINEEIEYGEEHFRPENEQINKGLKIARKLVRTAPSVDNGWISVKDRLPENDGFFLAWYTFKDGRHALDIFYFNAGSPISNAITHWMSLPEPPKGECK